MKRLLLLLLAVGWSGLAAAQPIDSGTISAFGTDCTVVARCASIAVPRVTAITVTVTGTFTGTLQFEGSGDGGTTWTSALAINLATGAGVTSTTAVGSWSISNPGWAYVRVRASALASGTPSVYFTVGYGVARWVSPFVSTLFLSDGSAAAPSLTFASEPGLGWYRPAAALMFAPVGKYFGSSYNAAGGVIIGGGAVVLGSTAKLNWTVGTEQQGVDTALSRGSAGELNLTQMEPTPPAPTVALAGAGAGNVDTGAHTYVQTCVTAGGQTTYAAGNVATVADKTTNGKVTVTLRPCSPVATGRNLYRSAAGTTTPLFLLAASPVIANSQITQTYVDNIADASLQAGTAPTSNTAYDTHYTLPPSGAGVPRLVGYGRVEGVTNAAVASVATFTPSADGSFEVNANVLVTVATTHNFNVVVGYTDEGNTARTAPLPFAMVNGSYSAAIQNTNGAGPYAGMAVVIRAKANTAITILTQGTVTTVTYNVEGFIVQKR